VVLTGAARAVLAGAARATIASFMAQYLPDQPVDELRLRSFGRLRAGRTPQSEAKLTKA
jgi:hypothetical protein